MVATEAMMTRQDGDTGSAGGSGEVHCTQAEGGSSGGGGRAAAATGGTTARKGMMAASSDKPDIYMGREFVALKKKNLLF